MTRHVRFLTLGLLLLGATVALAVGFALRGRTALAALSATRTTATTVTVPNFGDVAVLASNQPARAFVVLAADRAHEAERDADAEELAKAGAIAVSFDFEAFRSALAKDPPERECHYVADDLKDLAQAVQRRLGLKQYYPPVVVGIGDGAPFAYAALAQAPDNTLAAAISVGFKPRLASDRPYCFEPKLDPPEGGVLILPPAPKLPGPWRVIDEPTERDRIETFQRPIDEGEFVAAKGEAARRRALIEGAIDVGRRDDHGGESLPVSIIRPEGATVALAVIISGDGGWRDIDKSIGEVLAKRGIAVVGVDALRYFWSERPPRQVAADLDHLLARYGEEFGTSRYALIGYSFGADVIPYAWPLLERATRARVKLISLLGLGLTADFEITVEGFIGSASPDSRPLAPAVARLPLSRTQCIYGEEEAKARETSCTVPEIYGAQRVRMKGGHHFDGDYDAVAAAILKRLAASPAPE